MYEFYFPELSVGNLEKSTEPVGFERKKKEEEQLKRA
jgi:hypothetical protein